MPLYRDAFSPVLLSSPVLLVSDEQKEYVRAVLDISSSDSRFAEKAYIAIHRILTGGSVKVPTITSLVPNSAELGDPSFTLHVHGTNFTVGSKIVFNGGEETTTFVSATEVTTGVDMTSASVAVSVPVAVVSEDGVLSNNMSFSFSEGSPAATRKVTKEVMKEEKK